MQRSSAAADVGGLAREPAARGGLGARLRHGARRGGTAAWSAGAPHEHRIDREQRCEGHGPGRLSELSGSCGFGPALGKTHRQTGQLDSALRRGSGAAAASAGRGRQRHIDGALRQAGRQRLRLRQRRPLRLLLRLRRRRGHDALPTGQLDSTLRRGSGTTAASGPRSRATTSRRRSPAASGATAAPASAPAPTPRATATASATATARATAAPTEGAARRVHVARQHGPERVLTGQDGRGREQARRREDRREEGARRQPDPLTGARSRRPGECPADIRDEITGGRGLQAEGAGSASDGARRLTYRTADSSLRQQVRPRLGEGGGTRRQRAGRQAACSDSSPSGGSESSSGAAPAHC